MSYHKARPDDPTPSPTTPSSTVMAGGRIAGKHAEIDGKPIAGGLQNAVVEGVGRTPEEEKNKVQEYHKDREAVKKSNAKYFDAKTGQPKTEEEGVEFGPQPEHDKVETPPTIVKAVVEPEKKPVPKVEEKK